MSEYQYYEFRAIDSPLTADQRETLSSISSRARITSNTASFVYNYGSFHGDTEKLIQGDLRGVYLAWLKAAETGFLMGNIDADTLEPPVPEGLNDLSQAQQALVQYLEINEAMIAVAAQKSKPQQKTETLEKYIERLPKPEQQHYLMRLSRGENNLSVLLNRRLLELAGQKLQLRDDGNKKDQRTISALMKEAKLIH
jgi:hypothetical protein